MIPRSHPPEALWPGYVQGGSPATLRLMLEAHLDFCDECGAKVAALSDMGGALLRSLAPEPPDAALLARILDHLPAPGPVSDLPLPPSLARRLGAPAAKAWQGILKAGVRFLEVAVEEATATRLFLVHLRAGSAFPHHAHTGAEQALILAGGAQDGAVVLEAGDWKAYAPGTAHHPRALPDEDCWLLVRIEDDVRFSGWRGLLQRL